MMGLGMKRREFITGLRGPRAGRRGIGQLGCHIGALPPKAA